MSLDELRRSFLIIIEPLQNYIFDFWVEKGNIIEGIPEYIRFDLRHVGSATVIVIYAKPLSKYCCWWWKKSSIAETMTKTAGWKWAEKTGESP